ncbi:MAG: hypothetical protein ACP5N1_01770 [Candidatus Woesearchaeota archaeon]
MKKIHIDLVHNPREELINLDLMLGQMLVGEKVLIDERAKPLLTLLSRKEYIVKLEEMLHRQSNYEIFSLLEDIDKKYLSLAAENIANNLMTTLPSDISISHHIRDTMHGFTWPVTRIEDKRLGVDIEFNDKGIITSSNVEELFWKNPMEYLACIVEQDMALVSVTNNNNLIYLADISRFEKTPKDVRTGVNKYLGLDLMNFHASAKTYGSILPNIFRNLTECMRQNKLDLLTIDLLGGNTYTNGKETIRRFETDKVLPLKKNNIMEGIIVYADVFWQPVEETRTPQQGGRVLDLGLEMHREYKLVEKDELMEKNVANKINHPHIGGDNNGT